MTTVILAAGMGRRAYPFTEGKPKCLFKVKGKTLITHQIEKLKRCGVENIIVVTGYENKQVEKEIGDTAKIVFSPFYKITNSIASLWLTQYELKDDVIIINGDIFIDESILKTIIDDKSEDISMAVEINSNLQDSDFKLLIYDNTVIDMGKTLASFSGEYAGIVKVPKNALTDYIKTMNDIVERLETNVWHELILLEMIQKGFKVKPFSVPNGSWFEIDTIDDIRRNTSGKSEA